jgi:hypothetical protein
MMLKTLRITLFAVVATLALGSSVAKAGGLLLGDLIDFQYDFPALGSVNNEYGTQTVNPVASWNYYGVLTLTVSDNQIVLFSPGGVDWRGSASWNGPVFTDVTRDPGITGVTLDAATNVSGADASQIYFTSNVVGFNETTLQFLAGQEVVLDLQGGSVPEPSSILLAVVAGLAGIAYAVRRRNHIERKKGIMVG